MPSRNAGAGQAQSELRLLMAERMLDEGPIEAAEQAIVNCLAEDPASVKAALLGAEAHMRRGRNAEARADFEALVARMDAKDPLRDLVGAGFGAALYGTGQLDAAERTLAAAIKNDMLDDRAWITLGYTLFDLAKWPELATLAGRAQANAGLDPIVASAIMMMAAIAAHVNDEPALCRVTLADSLARQKDGDDGRRGLMAWRRVIETRIGRRVSYNQRPVLGVIGYREHLLGLLQHRANNLSAYEGASDGTVHLVGDSHCLSPAYLHVSLDGQRLRAIPHLVIGAKAWHLAPNESPSANPRRAVLARIAAGLPDDATVVAMFGEIDCRADEGLYPFLSAHPDIDEATYCRRLADDYVGHIASTLGGRARTLMIYGIPAPTQKAVSGAGRGAAKVADLTALFNRSLGAAAQSKGLTFLDPYPATANDQGLSNNRWHLDDVHLSPELFQDLIERPMAALP